MTLLRVDASRRWAIGERCTMDGGWMAREERTSELWGRGEDMQSRGALAHSPPFSLLPLSQPLPVATSVRRNRAAPSTVCPRLHHAAIPGWPRARGLAACARRRPRPPPARAARRARAVARRRRAVLPGRGQGFVYVVPRACRPRLTRRRHRDRLGSVHAAGGPVRLRTARLRPHRGRHWPARLSGRPRVHIHGALLPDGPRRQRPARAEAVCRPLLGHACAGHGVLPPGRGWLARNAPRTTAC